MDNTASSFRLQDRTAILAGPCTTFNAAIATKLTHLGANVALIDRNSKKIQRFASQLMDERETHENYGRAIAIEADHSKPHHVQDAVSRTAEAFGGIDIFIDGLMTTNAMLFNESSSLDDLDRIIDVNLRSPLLFTHTVMRFLESRKRGRIVYLLHDLARLGYERNSLLAATRTGLIHFSKTLAREAAATNITVNCVALGVSEDFLLSQNQEPTTVQVAQDNLLKDFPHAVMTEPERMANLVAFLVSPLGAAITGQTVAVSQGLS